jgi:peroxiredoxin
LGRCWLVLLIVVLVVLPVPPAQAEAGLKAGTLAPRFKLKPLDGKEAFDSRELFKEAPATILILWDSYCPDCLATVKACQKFSEKVGGEGVQVVGINYDRDNLASIRGFLRAGKITFPNLHDRTGDTIRAYRANAYDFSYFVIDRKGVVRFAAYDHPPEIEKELERAVNMGFGKKSPLLKRKETNEEEQDRRDAKDTTLKSK